MPEALEAQTRTKREGNASVAAEDLRYQCSPQAEESQVGDRVVLYLLDSRKAVVLNPTGSSLWHALATSHTAQALAEHLQSQFPELTAEQATNDVAAFLQELLQHGLVIHSE
jgi:sirohydrochlorin ferrochelatase